MTTALLAETALLLSVVKPVIFVICVGLWGYAISYLDKDLAHFHMPRQLWNGGNVAVGVLGFVLWLWLPLFWLGLGLWVLLVGSGLVGYHFFRNTKVPPSAVWSLDFESFKQKWDQRGDAKMMRDASVTVLGANKQQILPPGPDEPTYVAHKAMEEILDFAIPRQAERVEFVVDSNQALAVVQIDGVRYPQTKMEPQLGVALIDYFKQNAGLDISDRRRRQKGKMTVQAESGKHLLELTTSGSTKGLNMLIEVDTGVQHDRKFAALGMLESQRQQLTPLLDQEDGTVLVVAPPHHGLTTTLYAMTGRHDPYTQHILTLQDRVTLELEGVTHTAVRVGEGAPAIAQQLNSLLLREPKVMMIDQLTDADTAKLICDHAHEFRFYVGLRQPDTFTALKAWSSAIGDSKKAGRAVVAVVAQRLLRKLCTTCRQGYTPDPAALRKLNLPADKVSQLYKHSGQVLIKDQPQPCPACMGLGYRGRTGVFEVMALDDEARELLIRDKLDQLRAHVRKQRMLWLQEAALARVVEGATSIAEITRVIGGK